MDLDEERFEILAFPFPSGIFSRDSDKTVSTDSFSFLVRETEDLFFWADVVDANFGVELVLAVRRTGLGFSPAVSFFLIIVCGLR